MTNESLVSVSVVVPVFNERENLKPLLAQLGEAATVCAPATFEFIFVDDGSRDGSREIIREMAVSDGRVRAVFFRRNFGQTAAMSCGIKMASGEIIIPMDADLQNDPADIPRLLEKIHEGFSCVSGWRKNRKDDYVLRKIPSWIANALISWMTGVHLHDYGCSLKAYRREMIQDVALYGVMHRFIPAYVAWSGARVTELVVNHRPRTFGLSNYGLSRVFKVVLDLFVVKFLTKYFNKPIHYFGAFGFAALALGGLAETAAVVLRFFGLHFVQTPLPTIGALFLIVGFQFILFGLMSEILMRTFYESKGADPYAIGEKINFL